MVLFLSYLGNYSRSFRKKMNRVQNKAFPRKLDQKGDQRPTISTLGTRELPYWLALAQESHRILLPWKIKEIEIETKEIEENFIYIRSRTSTSISQLLLRVSPSLILSHTGLPYTLPTLDLFFFTLFPYYFLNILLLWILSLPSYRL